ncbi:MAG: hypothetical protein H8D43_05140 [Chloroflexi bacterium]|nr:hypothetical protein [Chloroflexota bacterium]
MSFDVVALRDTLYSAAASDEKERTVRLNWEEIETSDIYLQILRAKVPGGWLVVALNPNDERASYAPSIGFYPDPNHTWNGSSLP